MRLSALRRLILSQYDTLGDFCEKHDIANGLLSMWISGRHEMRGQTIRRFIHLLHISQEDIGRYFFPDVPDKAHMAEYEE